MYSQICSWLDDFIGEDPPSELLDVWDLTEWLNECEIVEVFNEVVIPSFKNKQTRDDATSILHSLIWEYYLFRRDEAISKLPSLVDSVIKVKGLVGSVQQSQEWHKEKQSLLTASEFSGILDSNRLRILRGKLRTSFVDEGQMQTVFLSRADGKLNPMAWGLRYEPVVRSIYEKEFGCKVFSGVGRIIHHGLKGLGASPDGIVEDGVRAGRLIEIKAPSSRVLEEDLIPYEYYCQMQVQMEVLDVGAVDYCECRISAVSSWDTLELSGPKWIGAVAVVGLLDDSLTWEYVYSPLFPNNEEGRSAVAAWIPEAGCLEKQIWAVQDWQVLTVIRNRRWWSTVGKPEYEQFFKDLAAARADPMFLLPADEEVTFKQPMFID